MGMWQRSQHPISLFVWPISHLPVVLVANVPSPACFWWPISHLPLVLVANFPSPTCFGGQFSISCLFWWPISHLQLVLVANLPSIDRNMFFSLKKDSRTRGHDIELVKDQCRLDIRKHSFSQRTINEWNKLSTDCVTASSMNIYIKNKVDTYLRKAGYT